MKKLSSRNTRKITKKNKSLPHVLDQRWLLSASACGSSERSSTLRAWTKNRHRLSSEPKCNTPADLIIGTVDQDLRECCHAMLFAFVG